MSTRMLVLIPMKDPAEAKSRLSPALSEAERSRLALLLFSTVVRRIQQAVMGLKAMTAPRTGQDRCCGRFKQRGNRRLWLRNWKLAISPSKTMPD